MREQVHYYSMIHNHRSRQHKTSVPLTRALAKIVAIITLGCLNVDQVSCNLCLSHLWLLHHHGGTASRVPATTEMSQQDCITTQIQMDYLHRVACLLDAPPLQKSPYFKRLQERRRSSNTMSTAERPVKTQVTAGFCCCCFNFKKTMILSAILYVENYNIIVIFSFVYSPWIIELHYFIITNGKIFILSF